MLRTVTISILGLTVAAMATASAVDVREDLSAKDLQRVRAVTRPSEDFSAAEKFETMSAGAATSRKLVNANAFSHPSANLSFEDRQRFLLGNGLFRKDWVSSPASTHASDGLGPLFNARSCQGCHLKDGRGHAPASPQDDAVSLLVRLSVPGGEDGVHQPEPTYGYQLQDFAVPGLPAEGRVRIDYEAVPVELSGGATIRLRKPALSITDPGYGPLADEVMLSARVAPPMIGLGLLEAIPEADILANADPEDADGDGISGRPHRLAGSGLLGRFGWKAIEPSVRQQVTHAFLSDMGLSTPLAPAHHGECTEAQGECLEMPNGVQPRLGAEEVPEELLSLVAFYSRNLAVPQRRGVDDPEVLNGKQAFYEAGCPACHVPKFVTSREAEDEALRFQLIWPYSDLLLHDMGEGLADGRREGDASGREWRTPALWGIGLTRTVSGEATFLHDGRARSLEEAILWHGGEAQAARDRFAAMEEADRQALIRFLESL